MGRMKIATYMLTSTFVWLALHTFLYSEPAMLIVMLMLIWASAELEDWDMSPVVVGILPVMALAAVETAL